MIRLIAFVSAVTMLSACVSLLPEPKVPNALYGLGSIEEGRATILRRSVLIREPEAPRILSGAEMSSRDSKGGIRIIEGAKWSDRGPRLLQLALLDYLGSDAGGVALSPDTGARTDLELSWRLSEFILEGNTAIARAELTLLDGKTREPINQITVTSQNVARSNRSSDRAQALGEAGRDIVRQAAQFIAEATEEAGV